MAASQTSNMSLADFGLAGSALLGTVVMCQPEGYVVVLRGPGDLKNVGVFVPTRPGQATQDHDEDYYDDEAAPHFFIEPGTAVVVEGLHQGFCLQYHAKKITAVVE